MAAAIKNNLIEKPITLTFESRIHAIDGLRGVAILSVVIFHFWKFSLLQEFSNIGTNKVMTLLAYGVDLFFVISGFLIGRILLRVNSISGIKTFYIRRLLRIWPLYYLLLFLVFLALPDKSMFADAPYWSFFLFIFNYWQSFGKEINQLLGPLWSIAIEEQFYLLGPLLFLKIKQKPLSLFLLVYIIFSPILRFLLIYQTDLDIWRFTPTRIDGICIGLLLSIFLSSTENISFVTKRIKSFSFLALFLLSSLIPAIIMFPGYLWASLGHFLIVLAFGCVLLVVQVKSLSNQRIGFLNWEFLRYLGVRCYSIYLFHIFFYGVAKAIYDNFYVDVLIGIPLILLFIHFSWKYIEMPLIKIGRAFSYENTHLLREIS